MATLMVYRGDVLDREVPLGEGIARIGRAADNDIVLDDATFTVSRSHAELCFEQGAYALVDKNSENGIWVAGKRVSKTTLAPGVPVILGSYKLVLKPEQPVPAPTGDETVLFRPAAEAGDATVLLSKPIAAAAPRAIEKPAPSVPAAVEKPAPPAPPAPPPPVPRPAPSPEPPAASAPVKAPPPVVPVASPKSVDPPAEPVKPQSPAGGKTVTKGALYGGIAVVAIVVIAAVAVRMSHRNRATPSAEVTTTPPPAAVAPAVTEAPAAAPVADAQAPPAAPDVATPPASEPPAPAADAAPPVPAPTVPPPIAAPALSTRRVPASSPAKEEAAPKATPPPQPKPPRVKSAAAPAAPAASASAAKPKPADLANMFEAARSAMIKEDYLGAIAGFQRILEIAPDYPNAANLLGVARGGATNASHLAVEDTGNRAEMSGDYAEAARQYERALQLDPSSREAADAMRRLKVRMQREGQDAFKRGQASDAAGRAAEAITFYEKALRLLPPDDAAVKTASDRLAALKAGN